MIVDKIHGMFSFKQSKWLQKHIKIHTQKRNKAENEFERDFDKLLKKAFYGNTMESVRNRLRLEFNRKMILKKY